MKGKTYYYKDEINDDFVKKKYSSFVVDDNYNYDSNRWVNKVLTFVVYRCIMFPVAYAYLKLRFKHKIVGKENLKKCKHNGYFVYGNHCLLAGDAFIPNIINFPKKTYIIVSSENLSLKSTRSFLKMCGAIPLPSTYKATKNFKNVISRKIADGSAIHVYPEAHIWPYYTGIRAFKSGSFRYPIELGVATYSITNTFHKGKFGKTPKVVTYIDGPFYPNINLPKKQQIENLRQQVYSAMCDRAKLNSYNINTYIKGE